MFDIADDIEHPRTDEFTVAWEQQFLGNMRLVATGIWRTTANFINNVVDGALWRPITLTNALTNQPYTAYYWQNQATTSENFLIRNIDGFQDRAIDGSVIGTIDAQRDYKALMLLLSRRLANRWGFQGSYVLAKAEGNVDNTGFGNWVGGHAWVSPNTALTNNIGEMTNSRRHEFKVYATYLIPKIEVMVSPAYTGLSGRPYTPVHAALRQHPEHPGVLHTAADLSGTTRHRDQRLRPLRRPAGRKGVPGVGTPIRHLRRHHEPVQRFGGHHEADPLSQHIDRGQHGTLRGPDSRAERATITFGGRWSF